ncbi:hypothetical protein B0H63DRAFT_222488 [Podospora didyma]|uniref:SIS domain-containing protein n=1 Tax=Podospora didyma TaxID=330526 RepID=A0AAE0KK31_9PEZI|nr:hypothetical protein B0H63DRAFT_222488 [Podospora didyma]
MVEQRPVHNSEVYLLRQTPYQNVPPLSPPSPITPAEDDYCTPIEPLSLSQPAIAACDEKLALEERLVSAVHVLHTETTALQRITQLYSSDRVARDGFNRAVEAITRRQGDQGKNGKVVVVGVGKSGHIAKKLVATFNSLAIQAVFLHPTEALHGDLGQIGRNDTLLLITFSGKTQELLLLLPHLDKTLPLILLTSHTRPETCELIRLRPDTILLPAPIHEAETVSFGVSAPTTSTTVALTVGDALAIVASQELHSTTGVASVFARNHPGGAIGAALRRPREDVVRNLVVPLDAIGHLDSNSPITGADVLRAGYASPSGWVRLSNGAVIAPPRIRCLAAADLARHVCDDLTWLVTPQTAFVPMAADATVRHAAEWLRELMRRRQQNLPPSASEVLAQESERDADQDGSIVAVMEKGICIGLVEAAKVLHQEAESNK